MLTRSSTANLPIISHQHFLTTLHESSFHKKQMVGSSVWKNVCWATVSLFLAEETVFENKTSLFQDILLPPSPHLGGCCFEGFSAGEVVFLLFFPFQYADRLLTAALLTHSPISQSLFFPETFTSVRTDGDENNIAK